MIYPNAITQTHTSFFVYIYIYIYIYIVLYIFNYIPDFVIFGFKTFLKSPPIFPSSDMDVSTIRGALQLGVQLGQLPCHDGLQAVLQPGGKTWGNEGETGAR
jgi:hypothetical protein